MKNRAKCKLCGSIIESFHATDFVICKCGEIALDGGGAMRCYANDLHNVLRVDDEGNEIIPKVIDINDVKPLDIKTKPSREELFEALDDMIKNIEGLPQVAMGTPVTHYDLLSSLLLLRELLKAS